MASLVVLQSILCASTIPHCHISQIEETHITLTNAAIFTVPEQGAPQLAAWQVGDEVILEMASALELAFYNLSREDRLSVKMTHLPFHPTGGVFAVTSTDFLNKVIVLNDNSVWHVNPTDSFLPEEWHAYDMVFIGRLQEPFHHCDAILFNSITGGFLHVLEQ